MNEPANQPITNAVYGKKAAHKPKPAPAKPARKPRLGSQVSVLVDAHTASLLLALKHDLEERA
jgi:hypothetical protein